jgi:hypothetical protein
VLLPKQDLGEDRVVMKITGVLVNMLVDINLELYGPAVVLENRKKVLYVGGTKGHIRHARGSTAMVEDI